MLKDWDFWFAVITAVVAILALCQSIRQVKISNKQHLFDERVNAYMIANGLIQLYRSKYVRIDFEKDHPIFASNMLFKRLTNNTYLEGISKVIDNTLEKPLHKEFLIKIEDISNTSTKIKLLFSGEEAVLLSEFVACYKDLLQALYKYQIVMDSMAELTGNSKITNEEAQEEVKEGEHRLKLQQVYERIEESNKKLLQNDVEKNIEKQIKL